MAAAPIYVEILIRAPIEDLWERTQRPDLHVRWDVRFTGIEYLPRVSEEAGREFRYSTRIGPGLAIEGRGEAIGERFRPDGSRVSSLRFWSDTPISPIREGSGYWRYVPTPEGVRFLTWYDYRVRFGRLGRLADQAVLRPLMGWATAWSFDRLRVWLENGVEPEDALRQALVHHLSRTALALCWVYQGVVPKLLVRDPGELEILRRSGLARGPEQSILSLVGVAEACLGVAHLTETPAAWPCLLGLAALPVLAAGALTSQPAILTRAFNPAPLTIAMSALAAGALLTRRRLASAHRCRRMPGTDGA